MAEEYSREAIRPDRDNPAASSSITPGRPAPADTRAETAPGAHPSRNGLGSRVKAMLHWGSPPASGTSRDSNNVREVVETVVFVVVLVLLLKTFAAEAFVIPTGSMATTLWGYQKYVDCPQCGYRFPVNCSTEVEDKPPVAVNNCTCPNCRYFIDFAVEGIKPTCNSGDRVLVAKSLYDLGLATPKPLDVVVFKYPEKPQTNHVPMNYIKRLIGLSGQTIGIYYGKLYVWQGDDAPHWDDREQLHEPVVTFEKGESEEAALRRWAVDYEKYMKEMMHTNDPDSVKFLQEGQKFKIIPKPPAKVLAMRRIVDDNDHPARDLIGKPPRWPAKGAWTEDDAHGFRHAGGRTNGVDWLRYRNLLRDGAVDGNGQPLPELITDFIGYNTANAGGMEPPQNWVGDLILECEVTVEQPEGQLRLELSKGIDRFQARWDLSSGVCTLFRVTDKGEEKLAEHKTSMGGKGTYQVRFANVDERLVIWVNKELPFGEGVTYQPPKERGPFKNDLQPASIGVEGAAVAVHKLSLWRDTYYTLQAGAADASVGQQGGPQNWHQALSEPDKWDDLRKLQAKTLYVQPGHYLCFGDNSPASSDGRTWGLVPKRLLLGRALFVYYPFRFPYWPFNDPVNRMGPIR